MNIIFAIVLSLLATVSHAIASGGTEVEGLGLMGSLFIAFGVLIVMQQLIPGLMLLVGMLKGIFSTSDKKISNINGN